jgi:hypothetical protein
MLLAQSEAKFKYCPLLKTRDDKMKFCLGSMCMLWRFADPAKTGEDDPGYCGAAGPVAALAAFGGGEPDAKPIEDY